MGTHRRLRELDVRVLALSIKAADAITHKHGGFWMPAGLLGARNMLLLHPRGPSLSWNFMTVSMKRLVQMR